MSRLHRLALALFLCGAAPLAHASAYRSVCPADPGQAPTGELTATRVAAAKVDDDQDRLYEGAVWKDGALYLSDFVHSGRFPSRIRRFTPPDRWETVLEDSGSNGLALDTEGHLIAATHDRKQVARVDLEDGSRTALVSTFDGAPFNSPNDLVMAADGTLYFTDPDYQRKAAPGGQPLTRVYRHHEGTTTVVDDTLRNPNGIALSPEYVYAIGPGDMVPDQRRFGVFYMPRTTLAGIFDMNGAFNQLVVRLGPGADDAARNRQPRGHLQPHGDGRRVPAAGGQPAKQRRSPGLLTEVKRLGVELPGKVNHLLSFDPSGAEGHAQALCEVFPVPPG